MSYFKFLFIIVFFLIVSFTAECKSNNDMVYIPHGKYEPLFKNSDVVEKKVNVDAFYINKYPVTNNDFKEFINNSPDWNTKSIKSIFADRNYLSHWIETDNFENIKNYPVVNVSWFAAQAYCNYTNSRLPTLDEWEYVASASKIDPIGKNDPIHLQKILDWYISTQTIINITPDLMECNYWLVCGLHGSIWEWVNDFNSVILLNTDAEGGGLEEVLYCGASATNAIDATDYVAFMRFAFRNSLEANYTMTTLGFRCAKDI